MFKIHFFNTIWSDCILLEKDKHFALIDTASGFYYEALKEFLDSHNVKRIDFILLTHFHSDHFGNIKNVISDFKVKKMYFREYCNCEAYNGDISASEYCAKEKAKCDDIINFAKEKLELIYIDENIKEIDFNGQILDIIGSKKIIKDAYFNPSSPIFNQRIFSENDNSVGIFIKNKYHTAYLSGDITDSNNNYEEASHLSSKGLKEIYDKYGINKTEIYKSAHHGGPGNNNVELLKLINCDYCIITNTDKWLDNWSTLDRIKEANPNTLVLKTDLFLHTFDLSRKNLKITSIPSTSQFIIQGKN